MSASPALDRKVARLLEQQRLTDILIPGTLPVTGTVPRRLQPYAETIYLKFSERYLRCDSVHQYSELRLTVTDEISLDVPMDEDDELATASMFEQLIGDGYDAIFCTSLRCYIEVAPVSGETRILSAALSLESNTLLFIDPAQTFGIRIGGPDQRDRWLKHNLHAGVSGADVWVRAQ